MFGIKTVINTLKNAQQEKTPKIPQTNCRTTHRRKRKKYMVVNQSAVECPRGKLICVSATRSPNSLNEDRANESKLSTNHQLRMNIRIGVDLSLCFGKIGRPKSSEGGWLEASHSKITFQLRQRGFGAVLTS